MRHFDPEEPAVAVRDDLARIALQIELRARPSRVFQALLAPDDLCHWFCPDVRTAPFRGGSFLFWGDLSVASLYAEGEGGGPIYGLEPATSLWYCWPIAGETTDVVFYLTPTEAGTSLQLIHQGLHPGMLLMDFWHLRLFALRAYIEGQEGPGYLDYAPAEITGVHHEALVRATPAEVFAALTESERVTRWMNAPAQVDPRVGGLYDLGWRDGKGYMAGPQEITNLAEGRGLSYRWQYGDDAGIGHEVHFTLVEEDASTLVVVEHLGFDPTRDNRDYEQGWLHLLWSLKAHCEEGGMPITVLEGGWGL